MRSLVLSPGYVVEELANKTMSVIERDDLETLGEEYYVGRSQHKQTRIEVSNVYIRSTWNMSRSVLEGIAASIEPSVLEDDAEAKMQEDAAMDLKFGASDRSPAEIGGPLAEDLFFDCLKEQMT